MLTIAGLAAAVATSTALRAAPGRLPTLRPLTTPRVALTSWWFVPAWRSGSPVASVRPWPSTFAELPEVAAAEGSLTEMVTVGERALIGIPMHGVESAGFYRVKNNRCSARAEV